MQFHAKRSFLLLAWLCGIGHCCGVPKLTNEWAINIRSSSDSTPAIAADGTIYFGTFDGKLWAINPDGTRNWVFTTHQTTFLSHAAADWTLGGSSAGIEIKSSPAIGSDGTIYFGCRDRSLYAVRPDGKLKWEFGTGGWVDSSPGIGQDGTIYVGSWDKHFYAVSPAGMQKWKFATSGEIVSSPAIAEPGRLYFGSHDGTFYALEPDGSKAWEYKTGGPIISSAAIDHNGAVYFTSVDGEFYCLHRDGSLRWKLKTGGITESSPVIGQDGTIYVGVNERLWAISPEGKLKWARGLNLKWPDWVETAPLALADGTVCFVSRYGLLANLESAEKWNWTFYLYGHRFAAPVMDTNNMIYIQGQWTNYYAIRASSSTAQSSWPKFRGNARNTGAVSAPRN